VSAGLWILGAGLVTAVGHTTADACFSTTSGIRRFRRGPVVGLDGHPLRVSPVMPIEPACVGLARRLALLGPALDEAASFVRAGRLDASGAHAGGSRPRAGLVLCPGLDDRSFVPRSMTRAVLPMLTASLGARVAPERVDAAPEGFVADDLLARAAADLEARCGVEIPEEWRAIVPGEHSSGIEALDRAAEILDARGAPCCFVAAVDSACEAHRLEVLDATGRIQSSRAPVAPIPGEAAAVLVVARERSARSVGTPSPSGGRGTPSPSGGRARGVGTPALVPRIVHWAHEAEAEGDDPALGAAWSRAIDAALSADAGGRELAFTMVDLNGDRARSQAWSFAAHRTVGRRGLTPKLLHPAESLGDVYAATAPLLLALASRRLLDEAPRQSALIACAATFGRDRSAARIVLEGASD